ncbi:MAG: type II secretion system minor pseudopilin GspJ [Pseudomonadota bacterium]
MIQGSKSPKQAGFTLAETLVALFILAIVSSAGATLLFSATTASQIVRDRESETRKIDIAQRLIRQDIAALSARAIAPADGFSLPGNLFGEAPRSEAPFLRFVRNGWLNPGGIEPRSSLQFVRYALRDGRLIREASLRPDATQGTPIASRVLLEKVQRIELGFVRGDQRSDFWEGEVSKTRGALPDLIEINITFEDGTALSLAALTGGRS